MYKAYNVTPKYINIKVSGKNKQNAETCWGTKRQRFKINSNIVHKLDFFYYIDNTHGDA
jgi:hypothetical protein